MIGESAIDGFRIAITVAIMLLTFISLMKGITIVFDLVGLDFKIDWLHICSYRFHYGYSME